MITKEQALAIAKNYLQQKSRRYSKLDSEPDKIFYRKEHEIGADEEGIIYRDTYTVCYEVESMDVILYFIIIDANTGEVIKTLGPHGSVENRE